MTTTTAPDFLKMATGGLETLGTVSLGWLQMVNRSQDRLETLATTWIEQSRTLRHDTEAVLTSLVGQLTKPVS